MRTRQQRGFSLLEIMVVIMIIGLSLGMVGLSVSGGGPRDDIWNNIEKFMGMSQFATEHAILTGESVGLRIEPPSWQAERGQLADDFGWRFQWVALVDDAWVPIAALPTIDFPPTVRMVVQVEEQLWRYDTQLDRTIPVAAFYPSGDITSIAIEFSDEREPGFTQHVEVDETGELVWVEAPEPPEVSKNAF